VDHELHLLLPFYADSRAAGEPVALAVVLRTAGSTYRKPGACMLIARDGRFAGLLSGGCLEGDLRDHAARVIDSGGSTLVRYDMRGPDDLLWGLGSGCEGAMDILLARVGPAEGWQPLEALATAHAREESFAFGLELPRDTDAGAGTQVVLDPRDDPGLFVVRIAPPPHVLLLGGGPDALPVAELARFLGWRLSVADHRSAYCAPGRFPGSTRVIACRADELARHCDLSRVDAAVVMSHHMDSDRAYLAALAACAVPYVGLLGPQPRRERLLAELGELAAPLHSRLRAPIGLDIGAQSPRTIALAIAAEIQATLAGRDGRLFTSIINK
jgi:xanthine/CO dehydrogenase XdhC/CoxF family maturation factor